MMPTALKQESSLLLSPNPENSEVLQGQSKRLTCSLLCYKVSDKLEYVHQDCFTPENKPLNFKQEHVLLHLSPKLLWPFGKTHLLSFPRPGAGWKHSTFIYFKIREDKTGQWVQRSGSLWYLTSSTYQRWCFWQLSPSKRHYCSHFYYFSSRSKELHPRLWNSFNCINTDDRKFSLWFPLTLTNARGHCLFPYFMKEKAFCPSMCFPLIEQYCLGCRVGTSLTLKTCF